MKLRNASLGKHGGHSTVSTQLDEQHFAQYMNKDYNRKSKKQKLQITRRNKLQEGQLSTSQSRQVRIILKI